MKSTSTMPSLKIAVCIGCLLPVLFLSAQTTDASTTAEPAPPPVEKPADAVEAAPEVVPAAEPVPDPAEESRHEWHRHSEVVRIGSDTTIREGEEVGQLVVIFGSAVIEGRVHGDAVVVGGSVRVNGEIDGNLVAPLSSVELGPKARIRENLVAVGGSMTADPDARVEGARHVISWDVIEQKIPPIAGAKNWIMHGLILARPLPHQFGWWSWAALACAVFYLLTALIFRRPIAVSVGALESQPVGSFFMGVLMFILFGPLLVVLAATGVGLIVVPFILCAGIVAFVFGKIAVYRLVGEQVGKQTGLALLEQPLFALVVGIGILYLAYMIPVVGFLIWGIAAPLGFGAVILAAFRAFRSEGGKVPRAAIPPFPLPPAAGEQPPFIGSGMSGGVGGDVALLPRAGFWIRLLATILDLLLVGALTAVLHFPPITLLVWVAYHIVMWAWKGTTIGGVVFGLKLVRIDGRPVNFAVALVRSLASFFSALVLFVGFFWAGWNREKQSWHDLIAGTIVVRMPRGISML